MNLLNIQYFTPIDRLRLDYYFIKHSEPLLRLHLKNDLKDYQINLLYSSIIIVHYIFIGVKYSIITEYFNKINFILILLCL